MGGGRRPRPARSYRGPSLAHRHCYPASPGRPRGWRFHRTACAGWGPSRRGARLRSRSSPFLAKGEEPGRRRFHPAASAKLAFGGSLKPSGPLVFPITQPSAEIEFRLDLQSTRKPAYARGFRRACGLWHWSPRSWVQALPSLRDLGGVTDLQPPPPEGRPGACLSGCGKGLSGRQACARASEGSAD